MSLERELDRLDRRIQGAREAMEIAYATRVPDERKDVLFDRLDSLLEQRERLRLRYAEAVRWQGFALRMMAPLRRLSRALLDLANKPEVRKLVADLRAFREDPPRSRPAFWRGVVSPRADASGRLAFSGALPDNRRPTLPGRMRQKGRG